MTKGIIKTTAKYDTVGGYILADWYTLVNLFTSTGVHIEEATITGVTRVEEVEYGMITATAVCENLNLDLWDDIIKQFLNRGFSITETKFYEIQ